MKNNVVLEMGNQFQVAFTRAYKRQIHRLIEETRREALIAAKTVLKKNAVNTVLEVAAGERPLPESPRPVDRSVEHAVSEVKKVRRNQPAKAAPAQKAAPVLNHRILEEIEAIREQIRRNELLLSQIKPFVQQASNLQKE